MQAIYVIVLVGLMGGVAVGLQGPMASIISSRIGTMESVFIVHMGGAIASVLFLAFRSGGHLNRWRDVPWYALFAGVFGLVVLSAISHTIPRIGATTTIMLIIAGQLLVSLIIDHFGLLETEARPIDPARVLGIGVVFVGVWLLVR